MEGWSCGKEQKEFPTFPRLTSALSILRGPEAALLRLVRSSAAGHPHPVHQPLPGPRHHLHHLHQRHHDVTGALQPAPGGGLAVVLLIIMPDIFSLTLTDCF